MRKRSLTFGVGINDADYDVNPTILGEQVNCPYHARWRNMLNRCYNKKYHEKQPTYIGCTVCEEWLTFSNFKAWMEKQDWVGKELDKDILVEGNKEYSPENCLFVSSDTNKLLTDRANDRGDCLLGVTLHKRDRKFQARCSNGKGRQIQLGYFDDEISAHLAWKAYKHKLACKLADEQTDSRVAEALRKRFAPETNKEVV